MPFRFQRIEIPDVILLEPVVFETSARSSWRATGYTDLAAFGIKQSLCRTISPSREGECSVACNQKDAACAGKVCECVGR
jgi:hypothetical protein